MTKSKSGMFTKNITHLVTNTLPVVVIQSVVSLLPQDRYLLPLTTLSRYQPTNRCEELRNVSIVRYRMSLVTIMHLDFAMIH